jgi:hypothetical protein
MCSPASGVHKRIEHSELLSSLGATSAWAITVMGGKVRERLRHDQTGP